MLININGDFVIKYTLYIEKNIDKISSEIEGFIIHFIQSFVNECFFINFVPQI